MVPSYKRSSFFLFRFSNAARTIKRQAGHACTHKEDLMSTQDDSKQQPRQDNRQGTGMAHPGHSGTAVDATIEPTNTDSHQRQMEMHSDAWGVLEEAVGARAPNTGTSVHPATPEQAPVHESNDLAGGLPRSPGGANQLAGAHKMDDDTGLSRK